MNKAKKLIIATVTVGTLALGGVAIAERGDGSRMVERISSRLSLDDNQAAALESFAAALRSTREAARGGAEGGGPRAMALEFISGNTLDQGAALTALEARAEAMRAAAPELVAQAAAFYDGLDAEQQAQVREFLERGGKRRGGRR